VSGSVEQLPTALKHLVQDCDQERYIGFGSATTAMQIVLQQMLHCPHQGLTKRLYLESKVWELTALLLEPLLRTQSEPPIQWKLKAEDVDRVHYSREILLKHLDKPPSLSCLARQVGLNECTLKRGFRQVFGTTAFGCLHHYRLERARQLLEMGEMNVTEVSRAVGFADRSYFAAASPIWDFN
jgi:AraC-like DNA-binding protein